MQPAWGELLARTEEPSAFLSERWVQTWLDFFGPSLRPTGLVWWDAAANPVACAMMSTGPARLGPFPIRRTFLNASGAGQPGCEHNDVLCLAQHRSEIVDALVAGVLTSDTDEFELVGVREGVANEVRARWPSRSLAGHLSESPYVNLEQLRESGRSYLSTVSPNARAQIQRSVRIFEDRFGASSVDVAGGLDQKREWLSQLASLHQSRWMRRGQSGAFAAERTRRFHDALLERSADEEGSDRLSVDIVRLRFGDEAIGFLYNLRCRDHVSYYQSGFRYGEDRRLKPGLVSHVLAIEHYLAKGAKEYDFLGGEPEPVRYKNSLATDVRMLAWIRLPMPTLKMLVLGVLGDARRRFRRRSRESRVLVTGRPGR